MGGVSAPVGGGATGARPVGPGQESGDAWLVREPPGGALVAVVDGLGHGPEAAAAARQAIAVLADAEPEDPLRAVGRCHETLRGTRGVVMGLAWLDGTRGAMTWTGVGNVEGVLVRSDRHAVPRREALLARGGVVGRQLPALSAAIVPVAPGDTLVFGTDGIAPRFIGELDAVGSPQSAADHILAAHATGTDDALVLVVRYRGAHA